MSAAPLALAALNALAVDSFVTALGPVFEHADWVAEVVARGRPFASVTDLHRAMTATLAAAGDAAVLAFLRGHPALTPGALPPGLTADSAEEQRSASLGTLDPAAGARLVAANAAFGARFGFPFILAVRNASPATILAAVERRLESTSAAEMAEALQEVKAISWLRLLERVGPAATGALSLHVLDTVRARPAAGLAGELWQGDTRLAAFTTDDAGRSGRYLGGGHLRSGSFEWRLDTAAYFAATGMPTWDRSFLPAVSVRFAVWNPEEPYHVPVLLTPGSYTTYRGN
jgi:2-oxo-4-hydroxy-4-carboxy-5-ureidoimidazoline decarboxylase